MAGFPPDPSDEMASRASAPRGSASVSSVDDLRAAAPGRDFAAQQAHAGVAAALFSSAPAAEPVMIGRYRVESELGAGGMGVVYRAYDPELDRAIALKVLRPDGSQDDRAQARMVREARALAKLSHPNVIHVYDVGTAGAQVFVAMELVPGKHLGRHLEDGEFSWRRILSLFLDAGRGLQAAHDAGLVHRDFKPENVLVGDDGRVRVLDFGLARPPGGEMDAQSQEMSALLLDLAEGREIELTRTGALVGTPLYMAPEQYRGEGADAASDQFAFCVALYEALLGCRPFAGETLPQYARSVLAGEVLPAEIAASRGHAGAIDKVPAGLGAIIARGLAGRREERFPSMAALLEALAVELREPRDGLVAQLRSPLMWGASASMLLLFVAAGFVFIPSAQDTSLGALGRSQRIQAVPQSAGDSDGPGGARGVEGAAPGNDGPVLGEVEAPAADAGTDEGRLGSLEAGASDPSSPSLSKGAGRGNCHLNEDSYRLLSRRPQRRRYVRANGDCFRCRPETRRSRTQRFSPRDCAGYSLCSPAPSEDCE